MPEDGKLVIATLEDNSEIYAYRLDGDWWTGVENSADDVKVVQPVLAWRDMG